MTGHASLVTKPFTTLFRIVASSAREKFTRNQGLSVGPFGQAPFSTARELSQFEQGLARRGLRQLVVSTSDGSKTTLQGLASGRSVRVEEVWAAQRGIPGASGGSDMSIQLLAATARRSLGDGRLPVGGRQPRALRVVLAERYGASTATDALEQIASQRRAR